MTDKPQSAFHRAWNEPRRFIAWLTLLCALAFGVIALFVQGFGTPRTYQNPAPPTAQMIALLALIGFACGIVSFFLALIPPVRRLFAWLLQRRFLILAGLGTLVGLFYALENWRGHRAWSNFEHEWEAKGERFDINSLIPPAVPDEDNFYATKPWERFRFISTNGVRVWENDKSHEEPVLDAYGSRGGPEGRASISTGIRTDLKAWQEYYRGTNNLFPSADGKLTNYFPISTTAQTPAKDVLLALSKYQDTLRQLHDAARRPHARFWINYEDSFGAWFPHLSRLKGCVQYLNLHAIASLSEGDSETAMNDLQLSFKLGDSINSEPVLISYLVQVAMSRLRNVAIWEGLLDHRWSDAQLVKIGDALARENHLARYQLGMRGERAFCNDSFDQMRRTRNPYLFGDEPSSDQTAALLDATLGHSAFRLLPGGWFDQNKRSVSRMHVEFILPAVDVERMIASPRTTSRMDAECTKRAAAISPYNMFSYMLLPALGKAAQKAAEGQCNVDLARIAIALERHRLAHGNYPETLDALVPQFIAKLPHDVINGQPLKYRRNADASFILYSVGWNETDDSGAVVMTTGKTPSVDPKKGDWVWNSAAK